jgi:hypothetical protein
MGALEWESPVEDINAAPIAVHRDLYRARYSTDSTRFRRSKEWHDEDEAWAVATKDWDFGDEDDDDELQDESEDGAERGEGGGSWGRCRQGW